MFLSKAWSAINVADVGELYAKSEMIITKHCHFYSQKLANLFNVKADQTPNWEMLYE